MLIVCVSHQQFTYFVAFHLQNENGGGVLEKDSAIIDGGGGHIHKSGVVLALILGV